MFGKFCLRVLVGTLVICLFGGAGVLAMAVICTAGVGLIVVIPATYLIGLLCTIWFIPFGDRREVTEEQKRQSPERRQAQPVRVGWKCSPAGRSALQDYITGVAAKGQEWQATRADLIGLGWDAETVDNARMGLGTMREHD